MGRKPDNETPQTIDGETGKRIRYRRRIDLSNLRDVRIELAALYRRVDSGELQSQDGSKRAFMLRMLHDVIVSGDMEARMNRLEKSYPLP